MTPAELGGFGEALAERVSARHDAFVDAAVDDLRFPVSSAKHEVALVLEQLRNLESIGPWIGGRNPICEDGQEVALLLPYNVVSWAVWDCACLVAAGNRVRVRFSKRASGIAELAAETMRDLDVEVVDDPGPAFVDKVFSDDQTRMLIAYGSERLGDGLLERVSSQPSTKVIFEGPGKDPAIVLAGADAKNSASAIAASKFEFSGQQCIAPENVLCHASLHDELVDQLIDRFRHVQVGDPTDPATQVGPMASAQVPEMIGTQLRDARSAGAQIGWGGGVSGDWVEPTVVLDVTPDMAIFQEESFGPVIAVLSFHDEIEALSLARATRFGLNCMVFGPGAELVAEQLRGDEYASPTPELQFGRFGTTSVEGPLFAGEGVGFDAFGGYGKSGWIWDSGVLLQGPKFFAREASRDGMVDRR